MKLLTLTHKIEDAQLDEIRARVNELISSRSNTPKLYSICYSLDNVANTVFVIAQDLDDAHDMVIDSFDNAGALRIIESVKLITLNDVRREYGK